MEPITNYRPLKDRTVLVLSSEAAAELRLELERFGARVIALPQLEIHEPQSHVALDEAIENLFGYDWIVFASIPAVDYFLRRFHELNHDVSELDELRVYAIGEAISIRLDEARVHVDLIAAGNVANQIIATLEAYVGGREALSAANFLIPRSSTSMDPLPRLLEEAGARVDVVAAYGIACANNSLLAQFKAVVVGGGIDYVAFSSQSDVAMLAQLLDTTDLSRPLQDVVVACTDRDTKQAAQDLGLATIIVPPQSSITALVEAISSFQYRER